MVKQCGMAKVVVVTLNKHEFSCEPKQNLPCPKNVVLPTLNYHLTAPIFANPPARGCSHPRAPAYLSGKFMRGRSSLPPGATPPPRLLPPARSSGGRDSSRRRGGGSRQQRICLRGLSPAGDLLAPDSMRGRGTEAGAASTTARRHP